MSARGSRCRDCAGQASVELVAMLPVVVAVVLAILQALTAGRAEELAAHAAQSGAVALAEGQDAAAAARASVPDASRSRLHVEVDGSKVQVELTPTSLIPAVGDLLRATATADAGPAT